MTHIYILRHRQKPYLGEFVYYCRGNDIAAYESIKDGTLFDPISDLSYYLAYSDIVDELDVNMAIEGSMTMAFKVDDILECKDSNYVQSVYNIAKFTDGKTYVVQDNLYIYDDYGLSWGVNYEAFKKAFKLVGNTNMAMGVTPTVSGNVAANASYWKPCGHGVGVVCTCSNNGEEKPPAGRDGQPERHACTCPILNLTQEGCKCGAIDPYKGGMK